MGGGRGGGRGGLGAAGIWDLLIPLISGFALGFEVNKSHISFGIMFIIYQVIVIT